MNTRSAGARLVLALLAMPAFTLGLADGGSSNNQRLQRFTRS